MHALFEAIVSALDSLPVGFAYALVALIAFGETALLLGLVVPGEVSMVVAGILAARGYFSLAALIAVATVGAILGDSVGWFVGRRWGVEVLAKWRFTRRFALRRMPRAREFFDRHGGKAILFGRFVGGVRTLLPLAAGVARMPYFRRFLPWDVAASLAWASSALALGYVFGPFILRTLERATPLVTGVALALAAAWLWWRRRRRRARAARSSRPPEPLRAPGP